MSQLHFAPLAEQAARIVAKYVPQRVLVSIFAFMAVVNVNMMRHSLDVVLTQFNHIGAGNKQSKQPKYSLHTSNLGTNVTQVLRSWQRYRPNFGNWKQGVRGRKTMTATVVTNWTLQQQNIALSSFYVGYALSQLPGGWLLERYGGKYVLAVAILLTAVLTLITPLAMHVGGPWMLVGLRFLMGVTEGPAYCALCELLVHWVPSKERGKLAVFALGGGQFAQVMLTLCSTFLLRYFNCMLIFYFFGAGALLWLVSFVLFCQNKPADSLFIQPAEREYLLHAIPSSELRFKTQLHSPTPWRDIFTCAPIWALISAHAQHNCHHANAVSLATQHLRDVKKQSLRTSMDASVHATLPALLNWLVSLVSGWTNDFLANHNFLTTTMTRKLTTIFVALGLNVLTGVSNCFTCDEHKDITAQLNCALGVLGTYYAGIQLMPLDLSRNYAATLIVMSNTLGALATSVAPYLDTMLKNSRLKQLRGLFWLICTMLISGDMQALNEPSVNVN